MTAHTILIVDDEANQRLLLASALARLPAKCEIIEVESGAEALARVKGRSLSLVITDYNMPAMSGIELINALRVRNCHAPVVLISAYNLDDVRGQADVLRVSHLLIKPFPIETLRGIVQAALAGAR